MDHTEIGHATFESEHSCGEPNRRAVVALVEARNGKIELEFQPDLQINRAAMERERESGVSDVHEREQEVAKPDPNLGTRSITEIPKYIFMDILLKLSVNLLLVCRCVCKTWRSLISDPVFVKLHSEKPECYVLMRSFSGEHISRTIHFVEPPEYDLNYGQCVDSRPLCDQHFKKVLSTKLDIQVEDASTQQHHIDEDAEDLSFGIANSCRGFLCLTKPSRNNTVAVCNPILGEYVNLPAAPRASLGISQKVYYALGFSPLTKEYKVIRMFWHNNSRFSHDLITRKITQCYRKAEIHTLGTSSWRNIEKVPYDSWRTFPTYLSGAIHWLNLLDDNTQDSVISFDFVDETFQSIPQPPYKDVNSVTISKLSISLGELRGCLCLCYSSLHKLFVWVKKDYNDHGSWRMQHCLTTKIPNQMSWLWGLFKPISVSSNGSLLVYHHGSNTLLCYHPSGSSFKFLKISGSRSMFETIIAYRPTFISLKDVVSGEGLEVLNVHSRGSRPMLLEDTSTSVSLEEVGADLVGADIHSFGEVLSDE